MNPWMKRGLFALLGGVTGYAYYYFIGCTGGTCPITSSPYISTAYGVLTGTVAGWSSKPKSPAGA